MRPPQEICLAVLLPALSWSNGLGKPAAAETPAATVWRLEQPAVVGGHSATVLGAPRVVADATGPALRFNGATDGLLLPVNPIEGQARFTIEALINPDTAGPAEQRFLHIQDGRGNRALLEIRLTDAGWALDTFLRSENPPAELPLLDRTKTHPANRWTWVALVYANGRMAHYIDGVKELEGAVVFPPMTAGRISLGVRQNKVHWFKGGIREVRFHPVALGPAELQRTVGRDR